LANFQGASPVEYSRWLGWIDQSDPTNLPVGSAALVRNCRFTLTEVETRFGLQTAIQGKNQKPVTGLLGTAYTPESAIQLYFQSVLLFDSSGALQVENPTGTGRSTLIPPGLVTLPANSHMVGSQAYNRAWLAFSNLLVPTGYSAVYDLYSKTLYPYGMKPLGFGWTNNTPVLVGECCTPSQLVDGVPVANGNGHLYIATQAGTTAALYANQPVWPLTEGGTIADGGVIWKEQTPVMANRLPVPNAPGLTRVASGGTLPAGDDVYVEITLVNAQGETIASLPAKLSSTALNDAIHVAIPSLAALAGWISTLPSNYIPTGANVYVAGVTHSAAAPASGSYLKLSGGPFALGTTATIAALPGGANPPTSNTARITGGQIPAPIVEPVITRSSGAGTFAAGRDVYVLKTYTNAVGETLPGPASSIIDTQSSDAVVVDVVGLQGYAVTGVNLYECDVPTGTLFGGAEFPPFDQFALVGSYAPGATATITASATGGAPPTANTTGVAGNIAQDTLQGGPNSTQGYRYMALAYQDQIATISGIVQAAVVGYDVDESGWELSLFNLPTGPNYIKNVIASFSVADGSSAGPFAYNPTTLTSDLILMTATTFPNGTSTATVNFTDDYLTALLANAPTNLTDRIRVIWPQPCIDIFFSKSTNRIFQTGVPGAYSGHWASLAADPESYYGDTSYIAVGNDDGERAMCVREYRGTLYSLRERSGFELDPTTGDPATWNWTQRWQLTGPCGPRAVDVCGQFIIFVHSSGIYKFENDYPELVSKELPRWWNTINWKAAQYIWAAIDVEAHEVRFGFPVGGSTVPNVVLTLNYEEGWNNPLLFSRYSGKEITIEQCRKYSVDDIAGFLGGRFYRTIPGQPVPVEGPVDTVEETQRQMISQFLVASSGPDGTVQAITPGVYNDNGAGIDCQYEGIAVQQMMSLSKLAGININARGYGELNVSFIAGARRITDWTPGDPAPQWLVKLRAIQLELNPTKGLTRMAPSRLNERWRPRFDNGKVADAWFSLKYATIFVSPMFQARNVAESPQTQST